MRRIDADALNIAKEVETACKAMGFTEKSKFEAFVTGWLMGAIAEAPTISAVPVVRGEWVLQGENEHDYETSLEEKCSLCGRYVYRYDTQPQDNYCPNCGAKMEDKA